MSKIEIITTDERGGNDACEALWYEMASVALQNGHQVEIFVSQNSVNHPALVELALNGVEIRTRTSVPDAGMLLMVLHKIWSRHGARWFYKQNLCLDADIRVLNVGTMVEAAREPWASLLEQSRIPVAIIVHNNPEINRLPEKIRKRLASILSSTYRVCFVSDRLRKNAEQQLIMKIPSAVVVKNPVNLRARNIEPWPHNESLLMAVVGRLDVYIKGHIRLFDVLSSPKWKSRSWKLSIFGSGPDEKCIHQAIEFYGLEDKVSLEGFVEDVRGEIWRHNQVLLMPSMLEGMPLALIEAMLCGRPALCSDVGGAAEIIRDSKSGFLAGSPFSNQLAIALERLWKSKDRLKGIGEAAHQAAIDFLPENCGEVLLEELLDRPSIDK